jgi:hypothetical protein
MEDEPNHSVSPPQPQVFVVKVVIGVVEAVIDPHPSLAPCGHLLGGDDGGGSEEKWL